MNINDVFLATFSPLKNSYHKELETEIIDNELYVIEHDASKRFVSKTHISAERHYSRQYERIKYCLTNREKTTSKTFICQCGACTQYLLGKIYDSIYLTPTSTPTSTPMPTLKTSILEETLDEIFETSDTPTSKINPLDMAVLTFGKHKSKTFKDVFDTDKGYCIWCVENSAVRQFVEPHKKPLQNMVLFVSYIKQKFATL